MFDLTSSKLLILGVVALIVVGPKELPFLLRTIGKYMAMVRRHANDFRSQFEEAMREAELDSIKKDIEKVARDTENTLRETTSGAERSMQSALNDLDKPAVGAPTTEASSAQADKPEHVAGSATPDDHRDLAVAAGAGNEILAAAELPRSPEPELAHATIELPELVSHTPLTTAPVSQVPVSLVQVPPAPGENPSAEATTADAPHLAKTGT